MPRQPETCNPEHATQMTVNVLLFSVLKEKVGQDSVTVDVPDGGTGADVLEALSTAYPVLAPYCSFVRLAVNHSYVSNSVIVQPTDEIALITPVSGG